MALKHAVEPARHGLHQTYTGHCAFQGPIMNGISLVIQVFILW